MDKPQPVTSTAPSTKNAGRPFSAIDVAAPRTKGHFTTISTSSLPSPRIAIHEANSTVERPALSPYVPAPAAQQFQSPIRQHRRTPSQHREVKETLNARSEYTSDDTEGTTKHRINQFIIREEIGRGSYGAVHLATDQFGNEYAVKEFSKTRLRKRAQSNILRRPHSARPGRFPPGRGMRSPWSQHQKQLSHHDAAEAKDALFLIREEIAIMKKLNHPNLVQLIEVLDDPEEDSLYMVLEMCKKGVIMKVGLDDQADPYPEELCRHWFRDLILGIEYLHAQGVVHRDIKPDNLLLAEDDCLKIVDFGVSEMFEKPDEMRTAKSAGSPAFLPPELCKSRHGDISGKAADVWSMGVSLYCLKYGKLPYQKNNILEMYEAIRTEEPSLPSDENPDFVDLILRLLDKDPDTRICMEEVRIHPWVTKGGEDPLLSQEENCERMVEPPNELEVNHAFTRKMDHMLVVMMAINKFKGLISKSRVITPDARTPRTPTTLEIPRGVSEASEPTSPENTHDACPSQSPPRDRSNSQEAADLVETRKAYLAKASNSAGGTLGMVGNKGHAHDTLSNEPLYLGIGTGGRDDFTNSEPAADVVSDSPTGIDFDMYDRAFEAEVERIRSEKRGGRRTTYITKLVNEKEKYLSDDCMIVEAGKGLPTLTQSSVNKASSAAAKTLSHVGLGNREHGKPNESESDTGKSDQPKAKSEIKQNESYGGIKTIKEKGYKFADLVSATMHGMKPKASGNLE